MSSSKFSARGGGTPSSSTSAMGRHSQEELSCRSVGVRFRDQKFVVPVSHLQKMKERMRTESYNIDAVSRTGRGGGARDRLERAFGDVQFFINARASAHQTGGAGAAAGATARDSGMSITRRGFSSRLGRPATQPRFHACLAIRVYHRCDAVQLPDVDLVRRAGGQGAARAAPRDPVSQPSVELETATQEAWEHLHKIWMVFVPGLKMFLRHLVQASGYIDRPIAAIDLIHEVNTSGFFVCCDGIKELDAAGGRKTQLVRVLFMRSPNLEKQWSRHRKKTSNFSSARSEASSEQVHSERSHLMVTPGGESSSTAGGGAGDASQPHRLFLSFCFSLHQCGLYRSSTEDGLTDRGRIDDKEWKFSTLQANFLGADIMSSISDFRQAQAGGGPGSKALMEGAAPATEQSLEVDDTELLELLLLLLPPNDAKLPVLLRVKEILEKKGVAFIANSPLFHIANAMRSLFDVLVRKLQRDAPAIKNRSMRGGPEMGTAAGGTKNGASGSAGGNGKGTFTAQPTHGSLPSPGAIDEHQQSLLYDQSALVDQSMSAFLGPSGGVAGGTSPAAAKSDEFGPIFLGNMSERQLAGWLLQKKATTRLEHTRQGADLHHRSPFSPVLPGGAAQRAFLNASRAPAASVGVGAKSSNQHDQDQCDYDPEEEIATILDMFLLFLGDEEFQVSAAQQIWLHLMRNLDQKNDYNAWEQQYDAFSLIVEKSDFKLLRLLLSKRFGGGGGERERSIAPTAVIGGSATSDGSPSQQLFPAPAEEDSLLEVLVSQFAVVLEEMAKKERIVKNKCAARLRGILKAQAKNSAISELATTSSRAASRNAKGTSGSSSTTLQESSSSRLVTGSRSKEVIPGAGSGTAHSSGREHQHPHQEKPSAAKEVYSYTKASSRYAPSLQHSSSLQDRDQLDNLSFRSPPPSSSNLASCQLEDRFLDVTTTSQQGSRNNSKESSSANHLDLLNVKNLKHHDMPTANSVVVGGGSSTSTTAAQRSASESAMKMIAGKAIRPSRLALKPLNLEQLEVQSGQRSRSSRHTGGGRARSSARMSRSPMPSSAAGHHLLDEGSRSSAQKKHHAMSARAELPAFSSLTGAAGGAGSNKIITPTSSQRREQRGSCFTPSTSGANVGFPGSRSSPWSSSQPLSRSNAESEAEGSHQDSARTPPDQHQETTCEDASAMFLNKPEDKLLALADEAAFEFLAFNMDLVSKSITTVRLQKARQEEITHRLNSREKMLGAGEFLMQLNAGSGVVAAAGGVDHFGGPVLNLPYASARSSASSGRDGSYNKPSRSCLDPKTSALENALEKRMFFSTGDAEHQLKGESQQLPESLSEVVFSDIPLPLTGIVPEASWGRTGSMAREGAAGAAGSQSTTASGSPSSPYDAFPVGAGGAASSRGPKLSSPQAGRAAMNAGGGLTGRGSVPAPFGLDTKEDKFVGDGSEVYVRCLPKLLNHIARILSFVIAELICRGNTSELQNASVPVYLVHWLLSKQKSALTISSSAATTPPDLCFARLYTDLNSEASGLQQPLFLDSPAAVACCWDLAKLHARQVDYQLHLCSRPPEEDAFCQLLLESAACVLNAVREFGLPAASPRHRITLGGVPASRKALFYQLGDALLLVAKYAETVEKENRKPLWHAPLQAKALPLFASAREWLLSVDLESRNGIGAAEWSSFEFLVAAYASAAMQTFFGGGSPLLVEGGAAAGADESFRGRTMKPARTTRTTLLALLQLLFPAEMLYLIHDALDCALQDLEQDEADMLQLLERVSSEISADLMQSGGKTKSSTAPGLENSCSGTSAEEDETNRTTGAAGKMRRGLSGVQLTLASGSSSGEDDERGTGAAGRTGNTTTGASGAPAGGQSSPPRSPRPPAAATVVRNSKFVETRDVPNLVVRHFLSFFEGLLKLSPRFLRQDYSSLRPEQTTTTADEFVESYWYWCFTFFERDYLWFFLRFGLEAPGASLDRATNSNLPGGGSSGLYNYFGAPGAWSSSPGKKVNPADLTRFLSQSEVEELQQTSAATSPSAKRAFLEDVRQKLSDAQAIALIYLSLQRQFFSAFEHLPELVEQTSGGGNRSAPYGGSASKRGTPRVGAADEDKSKSKRPLGTPRAQTRLIAVVVGNNTEQRACYQVLNRDQWRFFLRDVVQANYLAFQAAYFGVGIFSEEWGSFFSARTSLLRLPYNSSGASVDFQTSLLRAMSALLSFRSSSLVRRAFKEFRVMAFLVSEIELEYAYARQALGKKPPKLSILDHLSHRLEKSFHFLGSLGSGAGGVSSAPGNGSIAGAGSQTFGFGGEQGVGIGGSASNTTLSAANSADRLHQTLSGNSIASLNLNGAGMIGGNMKSEPIVATLGVESPRISARTRKQAFASIQEIETIGGKESKDSALFPGGGGSSHSEDEHTRPGAKKEKRSASANNLGELRPGAGAAPAAGFSELQAPGQAPTRPSAAQQATSVTSAARRSSITGSVSGGTSGSGAGSLPPARSSVVTREPRREPRESRLPTYNQWGEEIDEQGKVVVNKPASPLAAQSAAAPLGSRSAPALNRISSLKERASLLGITRLGALPAGGAQGLADRKFADENGPEDVHITYDNAQLGDYSDSDDDASPSEAEGSGSPSLNAAAAIEPDGGEDTGGEWTPTSRQNYDDTPPASDVDQGTGAVVEAASSSSFSFSGGTKGVLQGSASSHQGIAGSTKKPAFLPKAKHQQMGRGQGSGGVVVSSSNPNSKKHSSSSSVGGIAGSSAAQSSSGSAGGGELDLDLTPPTSFREGRHQMETPGDGEDQDDDGPDRDEENDNDFDNKRRRELSIGTPTGGDGKQIAWENFSDGDEWSDSNSASISPKPRRPGTFGARGSAYEIRNASGGGGASTSSSSFSRPLGGTTSASCGGQQLLNATEVASGSGKTSNKKPQFTLPFQKVQNIPEPNAETLTPATTLLSATRATPGRSGSHTNQTRGGAAGAAALSREASGSNPELRRMAFLEEREHSPPRGGSGTSAGAAATGSSSSAGHSKSSSSSLGRLPTAASVGGAHQQHQAASLPPPKVLPPLSLSGGSSTSSSKETNVPRLQLGSALDRAAGCQTDHNQPPLAQSARTNTITSSNQYQPQSARNQITLDHSRMNSASGPVRALPIQATPRGGSKEQTSQSALLSSLTGGAPVSSSSTGAGGPSLRSASAQQVVVNLHQHGGGGHLGGGVPQLHPGSHHNLNFKSATIGGPAYHGSASGPSLDHSQSRSPANNTPSWTATNSDASPAHQSRTPMRLGNLRIPNMNNLQPLDHSPVKSRSKTRGSRGRVAQSLIMNENKAYWEKKHASNLYDYGGPSTTCVVGDASTATGMSGILGRLCGGRDCEDDTLKGDLKSAPAIWRFFLRNS